MICYNCENFCCNENGQYCMVCDSSCSPLLVKRFCSYYEPAASLQEQLKSVYWILRSLNMLSSHVCVKRKGKHFGDTVILGGGSVASVSSRFGNLLVQSTDIVNNTLILYVK